MRAEWGELGPCWGEPDYNSSMRLFILVLILIAGIPAQAATPLVDETRTYSVKNSDGSRVDIAFPWLSGGPPGVAKRANIFLHARRLRLLPARAGKEVDVGFNVMSFDSAGLTLLNQGRMFVVAIESEGCGAYCTLSTSHHYFDARDGSEVTIDDLVEAHGFKALAAPVLAAHQRVLKEEIARLEVASKDAKGDALKLIRDQLDLYGRCLVRIPQVYSDSPGHAILGAGHIKFSHSECAGRAETGIDELGAYEHTFELAQIRNVFTAYGRHLLLGEARPAKLPERLYAGTVGPSAVTVVLGKDGSASYFYDKYGAAIDLRAKRSASALQLTEIGTQEKPGAVMQLTLKGDALAGTWTGAGKVLPVTLKPLR